MKKRFFGKSLLAAVLTASLIVAVPASAESYDQAAGTIGAVTYNLTTFDELGTLDDFMQPGDRVKTIIDFSGSNKTFNDFTVDSNGKASATLSGPQAGGHKNFAFQADTTVFNGADAADFLQFEISNGSDTVLNLFYFKLLNNVDYPLQLQAGVTVNIYDYNAAYWDTVTTLSDTPLYEGAGPCLPIPAGFNGIVRIPVLGFRGTQPYATTDTDNYIFREGLMNRIDIYAQSPNYTTADPVVTFDNFQWVVCGYSPVEVLTTVRSANNILCQLPFHSARPNNPNEDYYNLRLALNRSSSGAKYIQFRVNNPSEKVMEIFYLQLIAQENNYVMELQTNGTNSYTFISSDGSETISKIYNGSTLNGGNNCVQVPAHSSGYIRIPLSAFSGGNLDNDNYVISENRLNVINLYVEMSNRSNNHNTIIGDFSWVDQDTFFLGDGDVNGDGTADVLDLVRAKKVAAGDTTAKYRAAGLDVNNDGIIKAEDLAQVKKVLLK